MFTVFRLPHEGISPIAARSLLAIVALWRVGTRWGVRTTLARWWVSSRGVTCWWVSSRGVTLSRRRRWITTVRLPICWLWCIPNWRRDRLIDAWHLLHWRHCHGLWAELPIPLVHFNFVLCLHTGANRPVHHIRHAGKDLRSLWKFLAANNSCNYREDASNLLKAEHETNDAVVTLSCLYVEFILQQEAGWTNWITKAQKHLKRKY